MRPFFIKTVREDAGICLFNDSDGYYGWLVLASHRGRFFPDFRYADLAPGCLDEVRNGMRVVDWSPDNGHQPDWIRYEQCVDRASRLVWDLADELERS